MVLGFVFSIKIFGVLRGLCPILSPDGTATGCNSSLIRIRGKHSACLMKWPLFPGESGVDQLVEIIKVLGTQTREVIKCMNPNYSEFKFSQIKPHPWHKECLFPFPYS
ncbi:uncharacterized protein LOC133882371 [Alnus glutinosa]|uniref:uncharacterized protein LOC133882371 n=1 Tax=Alnus glutinosa TaxID=3517 RepID=UPI002D76B826|nr:uncharacterized protein LOC133882371 [Alnus glutinosa]